MIPHCLAILIHGKWSHPNTPVLRILEKDLKEKNYIVEKPNMPWSRTKLYDQRYEASLQDLGGMIQKYKQEGVKKVVLIGHSLGANAAMAYQAHVGDADAIVAITPGHIPSMMQERDYIHAYILKKALEKIKQNEGAAIIDFIDNNGGIKKKLTTSADIFLSYFDPSGLAHMPATVKKFKKTIPVFSKSCFISQFFIRFGIWIKIIVKMNPINIIISHNIYDNIGNISSNFWNPQIK